MSSTYRTHKFGLALIKLSNSLVSWCAKQKFAKVGPSEEPMVTPSTYLENLSLYHNSPDGANLSSSMIVFLSNGGFCQTCTHTHAATTSIVSCRGTLVKSDSTS